MELSGTDLVIDEYVVYRATEKRSILYKVKRVKVNCIGHILFKNCLLKHVTEGKIGGKMGWGRRCKQLLDGFNKQGRWLDLKVDEPSPRLWRTDFRGLFVPVKRHTTQWMSRTSWKSFGGSLVPIVGRHVGVTWVRGQFMQLFHAKAQEGIRFKSQQAIQGWIQTCRARALYRVISWQLMT